VVTALAPLFAIVLFAFTAEAVVGFGSTVLTVTLGAQLLPLDALLPAFAALELGRLAMPSRARPLPLTRLPGAAVLALGGVAHGLFGAGGPMVVYFASRELTDKGRFRATLSALWIVLNLVLLANYASLGLLGGASAKVTLTLAPALLLALFVGERLHRRVDERAFRPMIYLLLLFAGAALGARVLF
jgi:uncharacterized membrane protein YfcA